MNDPVLTLTDAEARALSEGRKTQFRRLIDPQPPARWRVEPYRLEANTYADGVTWRYTSDHPPSGKVAQIGLCPFGTPGTLIRIQEAYHVLGHKAEATRIRYRADGHEPGWIAHDPDAFNPLAETVGSDKAPRWASRFTLRVTAIRAEPLKMMSEADCQAEGAYLPEADHPNQLVRMLAGGSMWHGAFLAQWAPENEGKRLWHENRWVWVAEFRPIAANIDEVRDHPATTPSHFNKEDCPQ